MTAHRAAMKGAEGLMGADASSAAPVAAEIFSVGFDYSLIPGDWADEMRAAANRIRAIEKKCTIEVGRELLSIKAMLQHGQFMEWVAAEFDMAPRTAEYHMSAWRLTESAQCANLPIPMIRAIARAPEHMQADLIKRVTSGDIVSPSSVRAAVKLANAAPDDEERGQRVEQAMELFARLGLEAAREVARASPAVIAELRRIVANEDG